MASNILFKEINTNSSSDDSSEYDFGENDFEVKKIKKINNTKIEKINDIEIEKINDIEIEKINDIDQLNINDTNNYNIIGMKLWPNQIEDYNKITNAFKINNLVKYNSCPGAGKTLTVLYYSDSLLKQDKNSCILIVVNTNTFTQWDKCINKLSVMNDYNYITCDTKKKLIKFKKNQQGLILCSSMLFNEFIKSCNTNDLFSPELIIFDEYTSLHEITSTFPVNSKKFILIDGAPVIKSLKSLNFLSKLSKINSIVIETDPILINNNFYNPIYIIKNNRQKNLPKLDNNFNIIDKSITDILTAEENIEIDENDKLINTKDKITYIYLKNLITNLLHYWEILSRFKLALSKNLIVNKIKNIKFVNENIILNFINNLKDLDDHINENKYLSGIFEYKYSKTNLNIKNISNIFNINTYKPDAITINDSINNFKLNKFEINLFLDNLNKNYNFNNTCYICYEENIDCYTECCKTIKFHKACLDIWLKVNNRCVINKNHYNPKVIQQFDLNTTNNISLDKFIIISNIINEIINDKSLPYIKILIFIEEYQISYILEVLENLNLNLKAKNIHHSYKTKNNIINEYKHGDLDILILGKNNAAEGINLEITNNIIFFTPCSKKNKRKQCIGRALRPGRTSELKIFDII